MHHTENTSQRNSEITGLAWLPVTPTDPPDGVLCLTWFDDGEAVRHEQFLVRRAGQWFLPSGSMHVLYTPTHYAIPATPERQDA